MALFSRKSPAEPAPVDDVPFESLRRSPRAPRQPRMGAGSEATVPLDPTRASKTRARRRLIGAIALGLAAIVFVPMLFDRAPVVPSDDIGLQIPDRDTPFEGRRGVPDSSRGPLKASGDVPTVAAAPVTASVAASVTTAAAETAPVAPPPVERSVMAEKPAEKASEKPVEQATEKPSAKASAERVGESRAVEKPRAATAASTDDPRALAALEGRTEPPAATTAPVPTDKTYAVQVAAFSAADKARGLRDQLVAGGLRSYTESVSTAQGMRTRVRLGPFPSREAADRAKQKLKTMKLDGSVVPL